MVMSDEEISLKTVLVLETQEIINPTVGIRQFLFFNRTKGKDLETEDWEVRNEIHFSLYGVFSTWESGVSWTHMAYCYYK